MCLSVQQATFPDQPAILRLDEIAPHESCQWPHSETPCRWQQYETAADAFRYTLPAPATCVFAKPFDLLTQSRTCPACHGQDDRLEYLAHQNYNARFQFPGQWPLQSQVLQKCPRWHRPRVK